MTERQLVSQPERGDIIADDQGLQTIALQNFFDEIVTAVNTLITAEEVIDTDTDTLSQGHLFGLDMANNATDATNDLDIAIGNAASDDALVADIEIMDLTSGLTKQIDASWAVGTNAGGLDTGSVTASTWYHVFLIKDVVADIVDVLFSTSVSAPTLPTGYTKQRRIGSIYVGSGTAIRAFSQHGDEFLWDTPHASFAPGLDPGATALTATMMTPLGIKTIAIVPHSYSDQSTADGGAHYMLVSSFDVADTAPSASAFTAGYRQQTGDRALGASVANVRTNTSSQIRCRISISDAQTAPIAITQGYIDDRGKT